MTVPDPLTLMVNGQRYDIMVEPRSTLADALREQCGLTGTHLACEQGICGSCTILLDGDPVRSCLLLAIQAEGAEVQTVEGLATAAGLHPVQTAFSEKHGLQCGFCTPGFVMLAVGFLERNPEPRREEIEEAMSSNLCRCTGYRNILAAVELAAQRIKKKKDKPA